jgi:cold shock CspA family protein
MERVKGYVKSFNSEKGYGFAVIDDLQEIFFHASELIPKKYNNIQRRDIISFEIVPSTKGKRAINVIIEERLSREKYCLPGKQKPQTKTKAEKDGMGSPDLSPG